MKYFFNNFFIRRAKYVAISVAVCALFLIASHDNVHGQWKLASGFSNAASGNNLDYVSGFIPWGDSLLADAKCGINNLIGPGPTPDSLFLSTDHGATWTDYSPNGGVPLVVVGNEFVGAAELVNGDINLPDEVVSYSSDQGQTWISDTAGWNLNTGASSGGGLASSLLTIGSTIYAASPEGGVFQQSPPGTTWTIDSTGIGYDFNDISEVGQLVASGNSLFLSAIYNGNGEMYVSTNQGGNWSLQDNGLPTFTSSVGTLSYLIDYLAASSSAVFAAVDHDTDGFGNGNDNDTVDFYETTNAGQNWTKMNSSIENWGLLSQFIVYNNQDLFAVSDSGFYYSTNSGSTWTQGNQGLQLQPEDFPNTVQVSGGNLVIGTSSSGAWYRPISDFGASSVAASSELGAGLNLALSENPASSSAVQVTYSMSDAGSVHVELMDILGHSIRMLQNGAAIPGQNVVTIDPLTLDPGTYFVRVETNGESAMQKLVVTR